MSTPIDSRRKELPSAAAWSFLDNLSEGVIIAKSDGELMYLNQAARSLLCVEPNITNWAEIEQKSDQAKGSTTFSLVPFARRNYEGDNGRILEVEAKPCPGHEADLIQISVSERIALNGMAVASVKTTSDSCQSSGRADPGQQPQQVVDTLQALGWGKVFLSLNAGTAGAIQLWTAGFAEMDETLLKVQMPAADTWDALFQGDIEGRSRHDPCTLVTVDRHWQQEPIRIGQGDGVTGSWQANDLLCVPLYGSHRERIGLIGLDQPQTGLRPDAGVQRALGLFAQTVSNMMENASWVRDLQGHNRELRSLLEANQVISSSLEVDAVLAHAGQQMQRFVGAQGYLICEWEQEANRLIVQQAHVEEAFALPSRSQGFSLALDQSPLTLGALTSRQPLLIQEEQEIGEPQEANLWLVEGQAGSAVLLPILLSEESYGLISVFRLSREALLPQQMQILQAMADQTGRALETALIFEDTYERERFYNALGRVSLAIHFTLDRQTVLELISSESLRIFGVDAAYIWQAESDRFIGSAAAGLGHSDFAGMSVPRSDGDAFVARVASQGEAIFINQVSAEVEAQAQFRLPLKDTIQAALGMPFEHDGGILGVLVLVDTTRSDRFRDKDVTQARIFGAQVAIALQNANLFEELRRFNVELDSRVAERTRALHEESNRVKILLRITSELSTSLDQDRVLNQALRLVNEAVNTTEGVILLINPETEEFEFRAVLGTDSAPFLHQSVPSGLRRDKGLAGWMIENRSAVIVPDTQQDSRWIDLPRSRNHRSVLGVPLVTSEEVIGVLMLFHSETSAFTLQQLELVEAAAIQVANAISNANLYLLIRDQAESLGTMLLAEKIEAAKSHSILESIADGVIVADAEGQITLANMAASLILGIPRERLIGKSVNELLGLYGQAGTSWRVTIEDWAANADLLEPGTFLADQLKIEDKVVSAHLSPVLAGQQYFGTVSVLRDVTRDVELDELKSEFVSTVSHELRTPMTSIKGYADLMMMGATGEMSPEQKQYLEVIKSNADRLHMLVNDLLDISRLETGKTVLDKRPVDISQLVKEVVNGHLQGRIQHENRWIEVHIEMDPDLPLVNADKARITQVLTNLLDNAFNYTPEDGEIRIGGKSLGSFVAVTVKDSGIGIGQEIQSKIFDRFFRADDSNVQQVAGTGLGLSIVQNLIEMHGGHLELESELGKGSSFRFTLPVVVEDSDPA